MALTAILMKPAALLFNRSSIMQRHSVKDWQLFIRTSIPILSTIRVRKLLIVTFTTVEPFENGRAKVQTASNAFGFIDKHGKLIIDTVFSDINTFVHGMAVVEGINKSNTGQGRRVLNDVGVIDTLGHFIVPYGKYEQISDFENGYFKIETPAEPWDTIEGYSSQIGFVDKTGKLVVAKDHKNSSWIAGNVHCGLAKMNLYKYWVQDNGGYSTGYSYEGFINLKGEIVINDTTYESVKDFSNNRAFIRNKEQEIFYYQYAGEKNIQ